jgi:hypothetical protein
MESQECQSTIDVAQFVGKLISSRQISRRQYEQLSAAILADGKIDQEELRQINRLFDAIRAGQLRIVD